MDEILVLTEHHFNDFFVILIFYTHLILYRIGYFLPTSIIRNSMKKRFQLIRMSLAEDGTPICPQRYRFKSEKVTMQ